MSVLKLRLYPEDQEILRTTCEVVLPDDASILPLAYDLIETMRHAHGAGLAAPQVGVAKRLFVVQISKDQPVHIMINPWLSAWSEEDVQTGREGCLSFPELFANVKRFNFAKVTYRDENWQIRTQDGYGFVARAFQHEIDHLDGKLFIDHLRPLARKILLAKYQKMRKRDG
jgi:peptide deformylase